MWHVHQHICVCCIHVYHVLQFHGKPLSNYFFSESRPGVEMNTVGGPSSQQNEVVDVLYVSSSIFRRGHTMNIVVERHVNPNQQNLLLHFR